MNRWMCAWGVLIACALTCVQVGAVTNPPDERDTPVTQPSTGTTLSGSLRVAAGASGAAGAPGIGPTPLMVIVPGSGGTDRDGNAWGAKMGSNVQRLLAEALAAAGISSLRYDKRVLPTASPPTQNSDLRFDMQVDDVVAWVNRFAADPRFSRVIVVGHSEGALIGAQAVQRAKAAALVSVAGASERLSDMLRRQVHPKLPPALVAESERILKALERGQTVDDVPTELMSLYPPVIQRFLISSFAVDPRAEFAKVKVPTLILQGTTDIQVLVKDALALAQARKEASVCIIAGMNHMLKDAPAGDLSSYGNLTQPLDTTLVKALVSFDAWLGQAKPGAWPPVDGCQSRSE